MPPLALLGEVRLRTLGGALHRRWARLGGPEAHRAVVALAAGEDVEAGCAVGARLRCGRGFVQRRDGQPRGDGRHRLGGVRTHRLGALAAVAGRVGARVGRVPGAHPADGDAAGGADVRAGGSVGLVAREPAAEVVRRRPVVARQLRLGGHQLGVLGLDRGTVERAWGDGGGARRPRPLVRRGQRQWCGARDARHDGGRLVPLVARTQARHLEARPDGAVDELRRRPVREQPLVLPVLLGVVAQTQVRVRGEGRLGGAHRAAVNT